MVQRWWNGKYFFTFLEVSLYMFLIVTISTSSYYRFLSILHHVVNRHVFKKNRTFKKCGHEVLTQTEVRSKKWLKLGSPPHEKLKKILLQRQLVTDLAKMNEGIYTTLLEIYHSVKIRYLPKSIFFSMEKMIAGTQLAVLDHNHNVDREQVIYFQPYIFVLKSVYNIYSTAFVLSR